MNFFKAIGSFFKRLFTGHNIKAIAVTTERAVLTATDVASGNLPAAVAEAAQTADAARSITTEVKEPTTATPSASAPSLTVVK